MSKLTGSKKATQFTESVIREMTRLNAAARRRQPVAGLSRLSRRRRRSRRRPAPRSTPTSTSTRSPGARGRCARRSRASSRAATASPVVADEQVTVCCGSTEAMMATMLAIIDPGDEVVVFEPFYENYGPDAILSGATPRYVTLHEPDWTFDPDELAAAFNDRTQARSSSTRRTTRPARCSRAPSSRRSPRCAASGTRSRSPTRSTSTSSTTAASTCRSRRSTAWPIARSRSTACRRPSASPAGGSAGRSRRRR